MAKVGGLSLFGSGHVPEKLVISVILAVDEAKVLGQYNYLCMRVFL